MILSPDTTTLTITAHRPITPGSTTEQVASATLDVASGTWRVASAGGSMGWVTRELDAARGASLLRGLDSVIASGLTKVPANTPGTAYFELTTNTTGTHTFAADTLAAQALLRQVFDATGRAASHGRTVRYE